MTGNHYGTLVRQPLKVVGLTFHAMLVGRRILRRQHHRRQLVEESRRLFSAMNMRNDEDTSKALSMQQQRTGNPQSLTETTTRTFIQQQHPLLERHYSTIGIGDVFVNAVGPPSPPAAATTTLCSKDNDSGGDCWWLPQSYLSCNSNFGKDNNTATENGAPILLWEMVGRLKSQPEDFVVRELAYIGAGGIGDTDGSLEVADLGMKLKDEVIVEESSSPPLPPTKLAAPVPTTVGAAVVLSDAHKDPKQHLVYVLSKFVNTPALASEHVEALDRLNRRAMQQIRSSAATSSVTLISGSNCHDFCGVAEKDADGTSTALEDDGVVRFSLALDADKDIKEQKQERGIIHEAIRTAFPLIKSAPPPAASTSTNDADKSQQQQQYTIRVVVDEIFFPLIPYLHDPEQDLPPLYDFCKRGLEHAQRQKQGNHRSPSSGPRLHLQVDLPRDQRRHVHHIIDSCTKGKLGTKTIADVPLLLDCNNDDDGNAAKTAAIEVHWTKAAKRHVTKKRKRENNETSQHVLCVLQKRKREHLTMVKTLVEALKCRQADIGLAGIKDMHSVTYQFVTVSHMRQDRILKSADFLRKRGVAVEPLCQVPRALRKGELAGNRFEIVVRNLCRVQLTVDQQGVPTEKFVPADEAHVRAMVERLRTGGFINFYGEQRLGVPGHRTLTGVRAFEVGRAMLQQRWWVAIDLLMTGRRLVNGVEMVGDDVDLFRRVWKESDGDAEATLKALPNVRHTVPRERTILKGLRRYGKDNPLSALQCLSWNDRVFFINAYEAFIFNKLATERIRIYGTNVVAGDLVQFDDSNEVVVVKDASSTKASIENVVLPMLGYDSLLPENAVGRFCEELLRKENVQFLRDAPEEAKIKGSYRRLLVRAQNVSFEMMPDGGSNAASVVNTKFSFDLPAGTYATMFFRELMLTTVARGNQEASEH